MGDGKHIYGCHRENSNRIWFYDWNCCSAWYPMCIYNPNLKLIETTYDDEEWIIAAATPVLAEDAIRNQWWDDVNNPQLYRFSGGNCYLCITYWKFYGPWVPYWEGPISVLHGSWVNGIYIKSDHEITLPQFPEANFSPIISTGPKSYTTNHWVDCTNLPSEVNIINGPYEDRIWNAHTTGWFYIKFQNPDYDPEAEKPVSYNVKHHRCHELFPVCLEAPEDLRITVPEDCCPERTEGVDYLAISPFRNIRFCSDDEPASQEYEVKAFDMCNFEVELPEGSVSWNLIERDSKPAGISTGTLVPSGSTATFTRNSNLGCEEWARGIIQVTINGITAQRYVSVTHCDPENICPDPCDEIECPEGWYCTYGWTLNPETGTWRHGWGCKKRGGGGGGGGSYPGGPGGGGRGDGFPNPGSGDVPGPGDPDYLDENCPFVPAVYCEIECGGGVDPDPPPPDPDPEDPTDPNPPPDPPGPGPDPEEPDPWVPPDPEDPYIPPPDDPSNPPPPDVDDPNDPPPDVFPPPPIEPGDDCSHCIGEFVDEQIGVGDGENDTFCPACDNVNATSITNVKIDGNLTGDYSIENGCVVFNTPPADETIITANYECLGGTPKFISVDIEGLVQEPVEYIVCDSNHACDGEIVEKYAGDLTGNFILEQEEGQPCNWALDVVMTPEEAASAAGLTEDIWYWTQYLTQEGWLCELYLLDPIKTVIRRILVGRSSTQMNITVTFGVYKQNPDTEEWSLWYTISKSKSEDINNPSVVCVPEDFNVGNMPVGEGFYEYEGGCIPSMFGVNADYFVWNVVINGPI